MADDAAALLIRIEASQTKIEKQMAAISRRAAKEAQSVEDRYKKANDNVARSFKDSSDKAVMSVGAMRAATANLSFQLNDIAQGLAMGTSPFTLMMQQGGQVAQVFQGAGGPINAVKLLGGAIASVVNPVSLATFAIIGLTGAAYQYFMNLGSDVKDADDVIKNHADLIRRIKDAYGEAAVGVDDYSAKSKQLLTYDIEQSIREYKATIADVASDLNDQLSAIPASQFNGATYTIQELQGALNELREGISNGDPDIQRFIGRLIDIENQKGTPENIKAIIREIINSGKAGAEVQSKLQQLTGVISGVGEAAARETSRVNDFSKSLQRLANIALPALSDMEQAAKDYRDAMSKATTVEEARMAGEAFRKAQDRIRVAQTIPVPGQRPNPESFAPERAPRAARSKKVRDSFDELDGVIAKYVQDVVKAESGGKANAKNPLSSATGLGQFIESTWLNLFRKNFPDRAKSMSDQTILALRTDADISKKLIEAYARENAAILRQAGVSVNEVALQLAHFLGPQGAISVLKAAPGTPVGSVLSQSAINANPSILGGGKTVDDVIAYAEGRVTAYDRMKDAAKAYKLEQKELNKEINEFAQLGKDILGGFISDLQAGKSATEALGNALQKVANKLLDSGLNMLLGIGNGSTGNWFTKLFGFAAGGYTGPGGVKQPAGIVHKGEVVWSQADIRRAGGVGVVESMRRGVRGYDAGGIAGRSISAPAIPSRSRGMGQTHIDVGVSVDNDGNLQAYVKNVAQREAASATRTGMQVYDKQLSRSFGSRMVRAQGDQL